MLAESDIEYSLDASSRISLSLSHPINQIKMNDLISDLNLSKDQSQVLASWLKERNLLTHGTSQSHQVKDSFVFCTNVEGLLVELGIESCGWVKTVYRLIEAKSEVHFTS